MKSPKIPIMQESENLFGKRGYMHAGCPTINGSYLLAQISVVSKEQTHGLYCTINNEDRYEQHLIGHSYERVLNNHEIGYICISYSYNNGTNVLSTKRKICVSRRFSNPHLRVARS